MTKLSIILGFTPALWWLTPEDAPPRPPPTAATSYRVQVQMPAEVQLQLYPVYGQSRDEIRLSMNSRKPQRWDGYTQWRAGWSWPGYGRSDCRLDQARLRTWISVSLPQWQAGPAPDPALQEEWNRFITELSAHERGHIAIIQRGFAAMQSALQKGHCNTVETELLAIMEKIRQEDREYDESTEHGRLTGARFPLESATHNMASR